MATRRPKTRLRPHQRRTAMRGTRGAGHYQDRARMNLRRFRQGSLLAVAVTSLLLMFFESTQAQETDPVEAFAQAGNTVQELIWGFASFLPKLGVALVMIFLGWLIARSMQWVICRLWGNSPRRTSILALSKIGLFLLVTVAVVSVLVGDVRALVGSLGLLGLALSWALQAPIESFTGWVLNTFRAYYRVGDRIEVGEVLGDVYKIDFLTTTVWEIGRPGKAVQGAQPTGALITFPNSEILRANIINYSKDFPFVWEDVTIGFAQESDFSYTLQVVRQVAKDAVGMEMKQNVRRYKDLLHREGVYFEVDEEPQVYLSLTDSFVNCTIRYLVPIRARRRYSSLLVERLLAETSRPKHQGKILSGVPRYEISAQGGRSLKDELEAS